MSAPNISVDTNGANPPLHEHGNPGETSSLGLFWPPKETDYYRAKGFYPQAILDQNGFDPFLKRLEWRENSRRFTTVGQEETGNPESPKNFSRITMRAVVSNDLLQTHVDQLRDKIEAIIPLEGGDNNPFGGTSLVYFGKNHAKRKSDVHTIQNCVDNLRRANEDVERTPQEMTEKAYQNGYTLELMTKDRVYTLQDHEVAELFALYAPFGWSQEQVLTLLNAHDRLLSVAKKDNIIVSAGIAEMAETHIQFGKDQTHKLHMVELTDAATSVDHSGKGLYSAVSTVLLQELAKKYAHTDEEVLVFGESNATALGVLKTSKHQGRTFAAEVGGALGYTESGMLPQHVTIIDQGEKVEGERAQYNNFYPTFINKSKLLSKYGAQ